MFHDSREQQRLALVMVGLPARGKTHIARRVARYLNWLDHRTEVFNVGNYRRARLGSRQPHEFFDPDNPEGVQARRALAMAALDDMLAFFSAGGRVGIYDATNTTRMRRAWVTQRLTAHHIDVVFVESVCHDESLIENNIRQTKLHMPDYAGVEAADAVKDFRARIAHYLTAYEHVGEDEGSFIRLVDVGRLVVSHRIHGYLPSRLVYFLMNLHVKPRQVCLTRHGQSNFNVVGRIGGDPRLSPAGECYADALGTYVHEKGMLRAGLRVWASSLERARQTAGALGVPVEIWSELDEINAGALDGLSYEEIESQYPEESAARRENKLSYRYPRGESYMDVLRRLEPVILEIEREERPILIIAHQGVLRALYGYLMNRPLAEIPYLPIPLHTLIQLTPITYQCAEERIALVDAKE